MAIFNKQSAPKLWLLAMAIFFVTFAGCKRTASREHALLMRADSALIANADTLAFNIICSIDDTVCLAFHAADSALFAVLTNQALDRMDYIIDDALAQYAVDYYLHNDADDDYHEGLAYYYMGHVLRGKNDFTALAWYDKGKKLFRNTGNLRYEFLCWNYMSLLFKMNCCLKESNDCLRKCLDIERTINNPDYRGAILAALCVNYSFLDAIDSTSVYADSLRPISHINNLYEAVMYESLCRVNLRTGNIDAAQNYCDSISLTNTEFDMQRILSSRISIEKKNYRNAIDSALCIQDSDLYIQVQKAKLLGIAYEKCGDVGNSFLYKKEYEALSDSILGIETESSKIITPYVLAVDKNASNADSSLFCWAIAVLVFFIFALASRFLVVRKHVRSQNEEFSVLKKKMDTDIVTTQKALGRIYDELTALIEKCVKQSEAKHDAEAVIERHFPAYKERITNCYPFLDGTDAICIICWASGLSFTDVAYLMCQSKSFAYMRVERARQKYQANMIKVMSKTNVAEILSYAL